MSTKLSAFHPIFRPIFSGVVPRTLKHHLFSPAKLHKKIALTGAQSRVLIPLITSSFSTRSGRDRMVSGSGQNARAAPPKSLIDDEADLSDWVSGLNSSSFMKTRVFSDSEDEDNDKNGGFRSREGSVKRRRDSGGLDRGADSAGRRGGGARGPSQSFSGRRNDNSNSYTDRDSYGVRDKGRQDSNFTGRRGGGTRGPSQSFSGRRNDNGNNYTDRDSFGLRDKGRQDSNFTGRRGGGARGSSSQFMGRRNENSNGGLPQGRDNGRDSGEFRRNMNFKEKRGGLEPGARNGRDRSDGKSGFAVKERKGFLGTDDEDMVMEEEKTKGYMNFKDLVESDEDDDDEEEEHMNLKDLVGSDEDEEEEEMEVEEDDGVIEKGKPLGQLPPESSSDSHLSESRFDKCNISPLSLKAIKDAGYERMTLVQEATLPVILNGKDVLAKARTGTGKTVAFLLPAIELVVKSSLTGRDEKRPPISVLVICPTRELASQAAAEANKLLKYHPSVGVQVVIGGTRLTLEQKRMQANPCQILVATPGRLRDHIENTSGFATRLMGVKVLVLDEADHLLDMGFRKEIEKIIAAVPKQRQTLLFSATVPQEVRQICHVALKRDHEYINTVQEGSDDTHAQVRQMHLVAPLDKHFPFLYAMLKEHIANDVNYKILVFCTTAMMTKLVAQLLGELNMNVREIHSRKPQSYRTRVSDEFRKSKGLILVTSDVSARGVDYPDVTLVIQIGVPSDRQQYVHRLGRTGRKGKEGQGILMLAPWEEFFLSSVKDLPISKAPEPLVDPDTRKKVERALSHVEMKNKEAAYQAWLGYYNSNKGVGKDKYRLVELANEFSRSMGLDNPPAISKLVLGKMGLKNIPGLRSK